MQMICYNYKISRDAVRRNPSGHFFIDSAICFFRIGMLRVHVVINHYYKKRNNEMASIKLFETIKKPFSKPHVQAGVSFIEIMIVIVIMAGLAAIAGPALIGRGEKAKIDEAKIQMSNLKGALQMYRLDNSVYPSVDQGLEALMVKPEIGVTPKRWNGPYMESSQLPKDPWGNDYVYQYDGSSMKIISLGADGEAGGEDMAADIEID